MDTVKHTELTNGCMKFIIAHDGNYNNMAIDRAIEFEVYDKDGNVIKTISITESIAITISEELTEENKMFYEALRSQC